MTAMKRSKERQYNDHNKKDEGQTLWSWYCLSFVLFIVVFVLSVLCPFLLWSLYCLSFVIFIVVIAWSVLRPFYCGHCIVCPSSFSLWPLYCLSFTLSVKRRTDKAMAKRYQRGNENPLIEGQTKQWPKV
jgi:hypothetical protein